MMIYRGLEKWNKLQIAMDWETESRTAMGLCTSFGALGRRQRYSFIEGLENYSFECRRCQQKV